MNAVSTVEGTLVADDGVRLAYRIVGQGEPVVLLHAFTVDSRQNWEQPGIAQAIVDSGRQVVLLDARGHGSSGVPADPARYGWERYGTDVVALLDHLRLDRCALVGYSLGACAAAWVTPREPRVRAAVLSGITADSIAPWPQQMIDVYVAQLREHGGLGAGFDAEAGVAAVRAFAEAVDFPLEDVAVPVLVLQGQQDLPADSVAARIPGAVLRTIPGNHQTTPLSPEFAAAVLDFLDGAHAAQPDPAVRSAFAPSCS